MSIIFFSTPFPALFFLAGFFLLTISNEALFRSGKFQAKETIRKIRSFWSFFPTLLEKIFPHRQWESLSFCISLSKSLYLLLYALSSLCFAIFTFSGNIQFFPKEHALFLLALSGSIIGTAILLDITARVLSAQFGEALFQITSALCFFYLTLLFPVALVIIKLFHKIISPISKKKGMTLLNAPQLKEMIRESDLQQYLDQNDQKLLGSLINFKDRVSKEIMVPRVDLFSLSSDTTIRQATQIFVQEGYSRIPIYQESLDQIVGVVLYKDLLKCYANAEQNLDATLETISKPVLYAPETKKASQLLQEFRSKQIHMAIIVDEYGGTEGIVTIEDILEELVGEIEDEYDIDEERDFWEIPGGGWMIDAKMTLLDIADQIGVHIPTHPEYETLGGFVFHFAGTIPSKGWRFSHDKFDLEVISSNERAIKKIKIIPRKEQTSV